MLRDAVIALSLSNLCFINAWRSLLIPASFFYYYHQENLPPTVEYLSLILVVIVLGFMLFIGIRLVRCSKNLRLKQWANVVFILIMSAPLFGLLAQIDNSIVLRLLTRVSGDVVVSRRLLVSIPLAVSLFLIIIAFLRMNSATRFAVGLILILAPLVLITFSQAIFLAIKYRSWDKSASPIVSESRNKSPRVLWMVFDELDFRIAFAERPSTVKLPELDRLASESLFADNAFPPAGETLLSMPALITGRLISEAHREGPDKLMIKYVDDMPAVSWETEPNIFSRARAAGFNTALFGWYHPYCRILGNDLTKCVWTCQMTVYEIESELRGDQALVSNSWGSLRDSILEHVRTAFFTFPLVARIFAPTLDIAELERKKHVFDFDLTYRRTVEAANNPDLGLILTHWPIPHPPNIYDRSSHRISAGPNYSYLDNLALADETLGRIRQSMEAEGTWQDMVVLVTSDHWWRPMWRTKHMWTAEDEGAMGNSSSDKRIPFILKMPGRGNEGILYEAPFNTVLSHDLLLAILQGEVTNTTGAARWLDQHRSIARSPYDERTFR